MAEKGLIEKSTMDAIADAIRTKLESSDLMLPSEMPALIGTIKGDPTLQSKTVTPSDSVQSVTADAGYDGLDTVTVNAIPGEYVKPTATKGATTYTPKTTAQTIAAGTYCSGAQTIAGDSNLVAANILSGKTIFGVTGSASSGGKIVTGTFSSSSTSTTSKSITHGLGTTPNLAVVFRTGSGNNSTGYINAVGRCTKSDATFSGANIYASSSYSVSSDITMDSTTVDFGVVYKTSSTASNSSGKFYGNYRYVIGVV